MKFSDPKLLAVLDELEDMMASPYYRVRWGALAKAHQLLCEQAQRIQELEKTND